MPHTLLLADDSVTIQRVIELTFADEDIRVVAVSDGRQAVQQAQAEAPDIVLADVGMPEMDGYEVAAFIKGTPGLSHIPVLLLTGAFEPVDDARARAAGCDGVLVKPFEPQAVISRVKDLIAGRSLPASLGSRGDGTFLGSGKEPGFAAPPPATDEYFDRLDAALSSFDSAATVVMPAPPFAHETTPVPADVPTMVVPRPAPVPDVEPVRAESAAPVPPVLATVQTAPPPVPAAPTAAQLVSPAPSPLASTAPPAVPPRAIATSSPLADAFEALLAAEQGRPLESAAAQRLAASDTLIDHITRQVIERLADDRMRDAVIEVAERLVREEIARIKSAAG